MGIPEGAGVGPHQVYGARHTSLRRALLATTMLGGATALVFAGSGAALAQSFGGNGAPFTLGGGAGGGFGQNGVNGAPGTNGGGGGGPGGTLGGAAGNGFSGGGGTGGANGTTAATILPGNSTGLNGGNATNAAALNGGGGGAGGYGYVLTTAGPFSTLAGQIFTGGNGGAGNGTTGAGIGGSGGGGLILLLGGTFTNVAGASLIGGAGGNTPSVTSTFNVTNGGDGLTTSNYVGGTPSAATITNAGTITGGAGGMLVNTPGATPGQTFAFSYNGGNGVNFLGAGSVTNATTGVITGGIGGAGFGGSATLGAGSSGFSGTGIAMSGGGLLTNNGQITGGAGPGGTVQAPGSRPASEFGNGQNNFDGGVGGFGVSNSGTSGAPGSIVNNATGVIKGGTGGDGTSGVVNPASPHMAAGPGGGGGFGISITSGSILNFGQIAGGAAGKGANATVAGEVGGSDPFNSGGVGVAMNGVFFQSLTMSLDNRGSITGGAGSIPGTSGAGAAGAKGGDGGIGVDAVKPVTGTLSIVNSSQITGGNGAAGSAGTPNGANGAGGVGIQMKGDGTIATSGAISGGLNGDGITHANAITFLSGVHTLTLQSGATFTGNVVVNTAAASNPGVAASNTLNLDGAGTGNVSLPQFQNFGHLTQTSGSGGTWTLSGAGTVTVDATISAGKMVLAAGSALTTPNVNLQTGGVLSLSSAALASDVLNINGGTLQVTGTSLASLPNTINFGASGGAFDIAAPAETFSVSQVLSGGGSLTKLGAGTLALTGNNTYSGGTTVAGGTLSLQNNHAAGTGPITTTGSVIDYGNGIQIDNPIVLNSNTTQLQVLTGSATQAGVISETGGARPLEKIGAGSLILTAQNTYSGGTTISAGTLVIGNGGTTGSIVGNVVNNGLLTFNHSDNVTFDGLITGTGGLSKFGAGTLILTADNTFTNGTVIAAGTLQLGNGGTTGNIGSSTVNDAGALAFNHSNALTFGGVISGAGAVQQIGAGTTILTGNNTYTGATSINAGTLQMGTANALSSLTPVTVASGATFALNNFNQTVSSLAGAGNVTLGSATLTAGNNLTNTTFSGVISGSGGFTKAGIEGLTLSGHNTYTGATNIAAGTLQMGIANALSASTPVTMASATGFSLNGFDQTIASLAGTGNVALDSATLTTGGDNSSTTFSGLVSGSGGLTKVGSGIFTLSGGNIYTGATNISAGTLQMGTSNALSSSTPVTVASGAIFALNSFSQTIGSLAGAGNVTLGSAILTAGGNNSDTTFSGVMSGAGSFTKTGAGVTTFSGTNTYTGATTVNAGTLLVNGSIASSSGLTVNAGGTVGGIGNLPKTTINGGTLSPGNSIGTIAISGSLSFVGAGNYMVEVSPAAADKTNVSGSPGTATLAGALSAVGTGGSYAVGTKYTVLNATGGVSGTFGSLSVSGSFGSTKPHIEYDANNVYLVLDPNALSLAGLTPNQRSVATMVNTVLQSGAPPAVFTGLFNLSAAQLPGALDQLSGEVHPSTASVLLDESLYARSAILGRLRQASYGGNTQMASLSSGGPMAYSGGEEMTALAYAKSPIVTKAPPLTPQQPAYDVVFWAQGFGAWGRFDSDGNAAVVRRDLAGFFSGVDTRVGTNGRLGVAAGYTGSRNALDSRGNSSVESGHLAGYGGWSVGNFNLRAGGDYAWHSIDSSRTVVFPGFFDTDTARYNGSTAQIFGEAGYGFAFGKVAVEPFAGAAWVRLQTDGFNERGGAAALTVAANSFEVGYSTLGIRAATTIPLAYDMMLVPRASAAWQHAFETVTPADTLAFQGVGVPFVIAGVPIARDSLLAEAGLDLAIGRSATIGISYVGQIANNVQDHAAKGRFSWKF